MAKYFACVYQNVIIRRIVCDDNVQPDFLESVRVLGLEDDRGQRVPFDFLREVPGPEVPTPPNPQRGWIYDRATDRFNPDPNPPPPPVPQEQIVDEHAQQFEIFQTFLEQVAQRLGIPPPNDVIPDRGSSDDGTVDPPPPPPPQDPRP